MTRTRFDPDEQRWLIDDDAPPPPRHRRPRARPVDDAEAGEPATPRRAAVPVSVSDLTHLGFDLSGPPADTGYRGPARAGADDRPRPSRRRPAPEYGPAGEAAGRHGADPRATPGPGRRDRIGPGPDALAPAPFPPGGPAPDDGYDRAGDDRGGYGPDGDGRGVHPGFRPDRPGHRAGPGDRDDLAETDVHDPVVDDEYGDEYDTYDEDEYGAYDDRYGYGRDDQDGYGGYYGDPDEPASRYPVGAGRTGPPTPRPRRARRAALPLGEDGGEDLGEDRGDHTDGYGCDPQDGPGLPSEPARRGRRRPGTGRRRRLWVAGVVALLAVVVVIVALLVAGGTQDPPAPTVAALDPSGSSTGNGSAPAPAGDAAPLPAGAQVTYEVTGSGTARTITYGRGTGVSQVSDTPLPWQQNQPVVQGTAEYTITAQTGGGSGDISCRITVDGAVVAEDHGSGDYAAVSCTGRR